MTLVRWQPFRELYSLQREMNRLFDDLATDRERDQKSDGLGYVPAAELDETADAYQLKLEIPGIDKAELDIQVTAEAVAVSGERRSETRTENQGSTRTEFRYGRFQRVIPLSSRINHQNVRADYKDGILCLHLPKAEEEKTKVVKVNIT